MGEAKQLQVNRWTDVLSGHIERNPRFWIRLASLETKLLMDRVAPVPIDRPVYVAGLARSGSTILLELVARHADVTTHRYRDFPPVLTPWLWNWFVDRAARKEHVATERAHRDRIKVTPESPEAFEEVIWMAFFPELHDPATSAVLDERSEKPAFEAFYRDHIRKLLLARGGSRYAAKGNYNVTRLRYLQKLFPDARFIVPIRDPVWHIASLMKQHELFCREGRRDNRIDRHLRRSGHFEFGLGRRAINTGDTARAERIMQLWDAGHEVEGWAEYWASVYGHVAETLDRHPTLRAATTVVRYEDLCADPASIVHATLASSGLEPGELPETARAMIQAPTYYKPSFGDDELALIHARTEAVARRFGYVEPVAATTLKARTGS